MAATGTDVQKLEAMLSRFALTVDDTAARISRVQTRLKKTGADVGALTPGGGCQVLGARAKLGAGAKASSSSSSSSSSSTSPSPSSSSLAADPVPPSAADHADKENTGLSQRIQELEAANRALVAAAAADKKRHEDETRGLRDKVYALRAQLISHSSGSYRRSMDEMQTRRFKLSSPASVITDVESVSDHDHDLDDHTTPDGAARRRSNSAERKHSKPAAAEVEHVEQLRAQLDAARLDAARAHEASREILRRYQTELAAAHEDNEGLRRELLHRARAEAAAGAPSSTPSAASRMGDLEAEVAACRGTLEHVRGDVTWLQFVAAEYKVQLAACLAAVAATRADPVVADDNGR